MTPAVKLALAYAHVTGHFPKRIHVETWSQARKLSEWSVIRESVLPGVLNLIADHPFLVGDAYMRSIGFTADRERRTSHSISYRNEEGIRGGISRDGSGWIWRKHPTRPGSETEYLTFEQMKSALKEIADANNSYSSVQLEEITRKELQK